MKLIVICVALSLSLSSTDSVPAGGEPCRCSSEYKPVCARGRTYPNMCLLVCEESAVPAAYPTRELQIDCYAPCSQCPTFFRQHHG